MTTLISSDPSSSMTTTHPCFSYDVFLSFRGEDTRKNFTDNLYTALTQVGIRTFRDDDTMDRGKPLGPELEKAIRQSKISVIVFSRNYASSKWCLEEVSTIIKEQERPSSKHEVVPVLYNVEPSDVQKQTGCFEEAFRRYEAETDHQEKKNWLEKVKEWWVSLIRKAAEVTRMVLADGYDDIIEAETDHQEKKTWLDKEKVKEWRDSLRKAGSLTGKVLADGYEAKFISNIVNVIRKKLDYNKLYIDDKLVGIKYDVDEIESWLQDPSPNTVILFIDGIGGIGKTTISKCIFDSNFCEYDGSCFLAVGDIRLNESNGLCRLQSQLLSTILRIKKEKIWNVHEGTNKVTKAIYNKKVLLVLDDVTTKAQLEALLGSHAFVGPQRFYPGSKVIVTTRHKGLLDAFEVRPKVHTISELGLDDSIKFFSLNAFHQDHPIEPYIVQSERVVHHCKGLPLALKVLGSSLRGKNIDEWEDAMRKLEAIPNPEIQKVLQVSYDTLGDDKVKSLFLHIACFFVGEEQDYIVKLLKECDLYPKIGIKNLMDRCLLYVEHLEVLHLPEGVKKKHERVMMHQLIMEMGREVVRQESPKYPGERSRLWHHKDCFNVLQEGVGTSEVEGLMFDMQKIKEAKSNFQIGALEKMNNLMLLQLDYVTFSGKYTRNKLPKKLRLMRWHGFPLKSIPVDIPLEKLVVLDMCYSKLKHVWDGFKLIESLKILNLSYSKELIKTPDFRGLRSLESLILKGCSRLTEVDESIAELKGLVLLDLTDCRSLRDVPRLPESLVSLQMSGCQKLGALGLPVQCLDSISWSSLLVNVNISDCNLFDNSFPNDWSKLGALESLRIDGNNVTFLPKCIQSLPGLLRLHVAECSQIQSILGLPKSVNELHIYDNMSLEKVQRGQNFSLSICECKKLSEIVGAYKHYSIDKVDRKIIRYLGLESIAGEGMELGLDCKQKVFSEFGIFSTCVSGKQIPSSFMYKERGPQISFKVPSHHTSSRIIGLNICLMFSQSSHFPSLEIEVYNKTKALSWKYITGYQEMPNNMEKFAWLSLWRCGNLLEDGDEIVVRIQKDEGRQKDELVVEECCINLLYEDDEFFEDNEELDGEKKEAQQVSAFDQMSWTDRLLVDISDYVHSGKRYLFRNFWWYGYLFGMDVGWYNPPDIELLIAEANSQRPLKTQRPLKKVYRRGVY